LKVERILASLAEILRYQKLFLPSQRDWTKADSRENGSGGEVMEEV